MYTGYGGYGYNLPRLQYGQSFGYSLMQGTDGSNMIYVNGYAGAQGYQMPPNARVLLLDSEDGQFFVKTTDSLGRASICSFKFTQVDFSDGKQHNTEDNSVSQQTSESNAAFEALTAKVAELEQYLCAVKPKLDELLS